MSTRRDFLAFTAGAVAAKTVLPIAAKAEGGHPDAELIRFCAEHIENLNTYNLYGGMLPPGAPDPLWAAYEITRNAIEETPARTLDGMLAKARAAKAEAQLPDGGEDPDCTPAAVWAWQLVNDLLAGVVA